jgi:Mg2+/Co2+ transporter CorB
VETALLMTLGIVFVLILCSAFFSGSETALMSSSKPKLHKMEEEGDDNAKLVSKFLDNPAELLGTILLGNNLVNIAASALATVAFTRLFGEAGVVYATFVMTFLVLVFAEVLPKTIASRFPEPIAMAIAKVMRFLIFILKPFTKFINFITSRLMNAIGIKTADDNQNFDEDDIKGAISLGLKTGVLETGEHRMLDSIVSLDSLNAEDLMQHRSSIESIDINLDNDSIFKAISNSSYSRIPMYEDKPDNIIGILYVKDFLPVYAKSIRDNKEFSIRDLLKEAYFVPETAIISELLLEFRKTRTHMRFVIDEYGDLQGLITLEDILEEIVGEIEDEHDTEKTEFTRMEDGSVIVSALFPIRDFNREFKDWYIPDEENVTLGGFVASVAEKVPNVGDVIKYKDLKFEVLTKRKQALLKLRIKQNKPKQVETN